MDDPPARCPGPDCWMCNGQACNLCGAGCWMGCAAVYCDHDVMDRHEDPSQEAARAGMRERERRDRLGIPD